MYRITFVLDSFQGKHDREQSHRQLYILLQALTAVDEEYLRRHPEAPMLYQSGVRYMEEPPGQEDWQDIPTCLKMRAGDCEDLACWRVAELRVRHGIKAQPTFTYKVRENGGYLYHIQVQLPDGRKEDPSRVLGMR